MRMRIGVACALFLVPIALFAGGLGSLSVGAKSALLINADTGQVLYAKNAEASLYPASLTKIATALYGIHLLGEGERWDREVSCPEECLYSLTAEEKKEANYTYCSYYLEPDGSDFSVETGEKLSLRALLHGILMTSGNDAANVLAYVLGKGDIEVCMEGLNRYLKEMGLQKTHFTNPHGLYDPSHTSTAFDLALLAKIAYASPLLREIVKKRSYVRPETNKNLEEEVLQTNGLIRSGKYFYPKAVGMKTGYTEKAGYNLIAVAEQTNEKGKRTLIAVLCGSEDREARYRDATLLFETAFGEEIETRPLFLSDECKLSAPCRRGTTQLYAGIHRDSFLSYYPSEEPEVEVLVSWKDLSAPIQKGEHVGSLTLRKKGMVLNKVLGEGGAPLDTLPLYALNGVERAPFWRAHPWGSALLLLSLVLLVFLLGRAKGVRSQTKR